MLRGAFDAGTIAEVEAACAEGVAAASGFLEQIGGRISVASELGVGTTFSVLLPTVR